jgi:hypothetical protein
VALNETKASLESLGLPSDGNPPIFGVSQK